jgi:hypothetical protein
MDKTVLHPSDFAYGAANDTEVLQRMADRTREMIYARPSGELPPITIDMSGRGLIRTVAPWHFWYEGDTNARVTIDLTGTMLEQDKNNGFSPPKPHDMVIWEYVHPSEARTPQGATRAPGHLREMHMINGDIRWGRVGLTMIKCHYCSVDTTNLVQNRLCAIRSETNGDANSNRLHNIGIVETGGFAILIQGDHTFDSPRFGENTGPMVAYGAKLTIKQGRIFGVNDFDPVTGWPHWQWDSPTETDPGNKYAEVGYNKPSPGIHPVFHLYGGGSLHYEGSLAISSDKVRQADGELPYGYVPCNTLVSCERARQVYMDLDTLKVDPDVDRLVYERFLPGNVDQWPLEINAKHMNVHRVEGRESLKLYERGLGDPNSWEYPTIRSRRKFSGFAHMHDGAIIQQDQYAPIDLSNVDLVAV